VWSACPQRTRLNHDIATNEVLEGVLGKEGRHEHEDDAGTQIPGVNHDDPG